MWRLGTGAQSVHLRASGSALRIRPCHDASVMSEPADGPALEPSPVPNTDAASTHDGAVRRRAAYFYGLIVCGAVLAADPENVGLWVIGLALLGTVLVYWVAE